MVTKALHIWQMTPGFVKLLGDLLQQGLRSQVVLLCHILIIKPQMLHSPLLSPKNKGEKWIPLLIIKVSQA